MFQLSGFDYKTETLSLNAFAVLLIVELDLHQLVNYHGNIVLFQLTEEAEGLDDTLNFSLGFRV